MQAGKHKATLYLDPRCFLCRWFAPGIKRWFARRGLSLEIVKLTPGVAPHIKQTPALTVGNTTLVGSGILDALRQATRR